MKQKIGRTAAAAVGMVALIGSGFGTAQTTSADEASAPALTASEQQDIRDLLTKFSVPETQQDALVQESVTGGE
ncbi:hypothetical protein HQQ81_01595 [Microbacteriaceae bacterium VKM Ac-2854]|nr:hypothetical protein [Microbacteriaceae bacterium VKM Ac-2854]